MSDAIREALAEVDAGDDDPGGGLEEATERVAGEEPDARPEGPMPDEGFADLEEESESEGFDVLEWATNVPEGTHRDFDRRDWWDTETGAENRVGFHVSDAVGGDVVGYPNGVGVLVGFAEMYVKHLLGGSDDGEEADEDAPDAEVVDADTAGAYV